MPIDDLTLMDDPPVHTVHPSRDYSLNFTYLVDSGRAVRLCSELFNPVDAAYWLMCALGPHSVERSAIREELGWEPSWKDIRLSQQKSEAAVACIEKAKLYLAAAERHLGWPQRQNAA